MNILCKIFGHKPEDDFVEGYHPKLGAQVYRKVVFCKRCDARISMKDTILYKVSQKRGVNIWGSAGICTGCKLNKSCIYSTIRPNNIHLDGFCGFARESCPINKFILLKKFRKEYEEKIKNWGDTLID